MKKIFTLVFGLCGLMSAANAATIDDVKVCKHSYVLVADEITNNGTVKPDVNTLVGDGYFLLCGSDAQKSVNTGKGRADLSDTSMVSLADSIKYGSYGSHLNSLRLKVAQDAIAMKITQGSKIIIFYDNTSRYPIVGTGLDTGAKKVTGVLSEEKCTSTYTVDGKTRARFEWTSDDDRTIYIGSSGDIYFSYLIVEANEAPGTPMVKVGAQTYDEAQGLYYRDVTCTPVAADGDETIVTYTTDGSTPNHTSTVYENPIRCYKDQTIKFQAYYRLNSENDICNDADNEANVSFSFNAPTLTVDGGNVTINSAYTGAKNYYSYGSVVDQEGSAFTLTSSATVTAYSKIVNGEYETFTTKSTTKDVYVLNPLKAEATLAVSAGVAKDSLNSDGKTTDYYVEGGKIAYDSMSFFIKNPEFGVVTSKVDSIKQYQIDGQEVYIKMNNTNITFLVDEKDSVDIVVTCSKNACKNINADSTQWLCFINVDGTNYGDSICTPATKADLSAYKNVVKFSVGAGTHTFQKYSGTGNILVSSIKLTPRIDCLVGIKELAAEKKVATKKYMLNGRLYIETVNGTFDAAGVRVK